MVRRAVFVDRDGVINANKIRDGQPVAPTTLEQFDILPGVRAALNTLKASAYLVIVVTNQPDVAADRTSQQTVEAMHQLLRRQLSVDDIKVCFHRDQDGCECRKPKPGLLVQAAKEWGIDLSSSYMVGDRWRDIGAGQAAGCFTIGVDYQEGHSEYCPRVRLRSLPEAVTYIVDKSRP